MPRLNSAELKAQFDGLLDDMESVANRDVAADIVNTALRLATDNASRLDLKITATALREMRAAYRAFAPYRDRRKVTMFGSARTKPDSPLYVQARNIATAPAPAAARRRPGAGPGARHPPSPWSPPRARRGLGTTRRTGAEIRAATAIQSARTGTAYGEHLASATSRPWRRSRRRAAEAEGPPGRWPGGGEGGDGGGVDCARDWIRAGGRGRVGAFSDGSGPVGGGSHNPRRQISEMVGVGVLPAFRRHGLAGAAAHLLARQALDSGVTTIFCGAESIDVARVYERLGFRRIGTTCIAGMD